MSIMNSTINFEKSSQIVRVEYTDSNAMSFAKEISLEDYVKLLSKTRDGVEKTIIPRLPEGTVYLEWGDAFNYNIAVAVNAMVHPTAFMSSENVAMLPFPGLIFLFKVERGILTNSRCFAIQALPRAVTPETEIYMFPYGNVYDDGKLCWGSNFDISHVESVASLETVVETFFNATMNRDLFKEQHLNEDALKKKKRKNYGLEDLLSDMVERGSFDNHLLKKYGQLKDVLKF